MSQKNESTASPTKPKKSSPSLQGNTAKHVVSAHSTPMSISPEDRRQMISEAAYYRAEQRAFYGECQLEDWLAAEAEINMRYPVQ